MYQNGIHNRSLSIAMEQGNALLSIPWLVTSLKVDTHHFI